MIQHYIYANDDKTLGFVEIGASTIDTEKQVQLEEVKEAFANYSLVEYRLNHLAGKILTQCDATFQDPTQRKAFKDIMRGLIADEFGFYADHLIPELVKKSTEHVEGMSDKAFKKWAKENPPVDISEVIAPGK